VRDQLIATKGRCGACADRPAGTAFGYVYTDVTGQMNNRRLSRGPPDELLTASYIINRPLCSVLTVKAQPILRAGW
jgi:hypothetical protein